MSCNTSDLTDVFALMSVFLHKIKAPNDLDQSNKARTFQCLFVLFIAAVITINRINYLFEISIPRMQLKTVHEMPEQDLVYLPFISTFIKR